MALPLWNSKTTYATPLCLHPTDGVPLGICGSGHSSNINMFRFFREMSMGQCPGRSVQNCPCSPHFLPQPFKTEAGRGSGGATVLFGSELLFLLSFWFLVCFGVDLPMVFAYFFAISPRKCIKEIILMSGLVFLSRSLCLRVWVDDVFCVVFLSSFFL